MSRKGGAALLQKDAPWRASSETPIPRIHHSPILRLSQTPHSDYAISVMKHPNPIGSGLAEEAIVEAAGPDCIVPGQTAPLKLLGVKLICHRFGLSGDHFSPTFLYFIEGNQRSGLSLWT
ncbi:uncharacterized protein LOC114732855 isoform X1 [Neltuma alba]|uniref:uncharacterized protein LOC114732855 isoform X1 n=1 Tax=Neltuma alba TaxID=207710 RepID=UPI0010A38258|nr:uncharacterized protein LOC114732855 isoform X1 [Prosopis alba]